MYVSRTLLRSFVTLVRPVGSGAHGRGRSSPVFHALLGLAAALSALLVRFEASAQPACVDVAPWNRLGRTGGELVRPVPVVLASSAAVPPAVLVPTGLDHRLRVVAQADLGGRYGLEPVSLYAPYVLAGAVLVTHVSAALGGSCAVKRPTAAMLQAMVLGIGVTGLLKWSTGRGWPNGGRDPYAPDRLEHPDAATSFRPFRAGLAAFPSGHTLTTMVAAAAFRTAEPELGLFSWVGYPLALGVGAGMWLGDHHWASDVLSGALLGEAIGASVGRSFASSDPNEKDRPVAVAVTPLERGALVTVAGVF